MGYFSDRESKHEKSITVKIYKWGVMQEHLVVTLDGTDYLGTWHKFTEFIRSRDTFVPAICYNESMGQSKHVIHVWLKLMERLHVLVVRQSTVQ